MDLHVHFKGGEEIQPAMLYLYLANGRHHGALDGREQHRARAAHSSRRGRASGAADLHDLTDHRQHRGLSEDGRKGARDRREVRRARATTFLKVYNQIPEAGYWGIIEAAKEHEIPVVGHAVRSVGIEGAIKAGQHIVHMEEFLYGYFQDDLDEARIRPLAEELKSAGISVVATPDHVTTTS